MSSNNLTEENPEDEEENAVSEIINEPQEQPISEKEEEVHVEIVKSEPALPPETKTEEGLPCPVCNSADCNCYCVKPKTEDEAKIPSVHSLEEKEEARVSIPGSREKISTVETEAKIETIGEEVQEKSETEATEYTEEEGEGFGVRYPIPAPELKGEGGEESEQEDLFGEEPWIPCDELPEQMYGEGDIEEEGESLREELGEEEEELEEEEEVEPLDEKISMDSEYLKGCLGAPLTYALLDIIAKRPTDPIHYLGHYLIRWRATGESKDKYDKEVEVLSAERQIYMENLREKERQKMLEKEQKAEEYRRAGKMESSLEDDDESDDEDEEDRITQSEMESVTLGD